MKAQSVPILEKEVVVVLLGKRMQHLSVVNSYISFFNMVETICV